MTERFKLEQLDKYKKYIETAIEELDLTAQTIQQACLKHSSLYLFYYDKYCELKYFSDMTKIDLDKQISISFIKLKEKHQIDLNYNMIGKYIDSEQEVIIHKQILAEIDEVKNKMEGIVESFKTQGFQLGNITKQRVAQVEEGLL